MRKRERGGREKVTRASLVVSYLSFVTVKILIACSHFYLYRQRNGFQGYVEGQRHMERQRHMEG